MNPSSLSLTLNQPNNTLTVTVDATGWNLLPSSVQRGEHLELLLDEVRDKLIRALRLKGSIR